MIYGIGMLDSSLTWDYAQAVMQNEMVRMVRKTVEGIRKKRKEFVKKSEKKTKEKVEKIFSSKHKNGLTISQEAAAIITEKSEIDEEIVRLEAHISKFRKTARKKGAGGEGA